MKIKILSKFGYQTYPITDDMIEVDEEVLKEIGKTKCFENGKLVDYDNSAEIKAEQKQNRIEKIKTRLDELNKDFIQSMIGADFGTKVLENGTEIDVFEAKRAEFISLHNELRELEGKEPRDYEV